MSRGATRAPRTPVPYESAAEAQRVLAGARAGGRIGDTLWLLEHPPTVTWGAAARPLAHGEPSGAEHLLVARAELARRGVAAVESERGGGITFHEPGQLVGYPIVDLGGPGGRDLHDYLRRVEEGLIALLAGIGIAGTRIAGRTGIWIPGEPPRKIAAIGVKARRWVTSHGFALNIENALEGFGWIVPCGIRDAGVTSIARELAGRSPPGWSEIEDRAHRALEASLGRPLSLVRGAAG
ncbi:MAG TPA: lipoyl(octanoyl) transferase LipB, partial [Candidatus Eisenbacteria bacterium]|nr:lipoyl(octanoyl) transferase LipB [Candidatus Eisenbacteria bacterium]